MPEPDRPPLSAALFDTAIGTCALAWTDAGMARFLLPESTVAATRTGIMRRHRGMDVHEVEPTGVMAEAIAHIRSHLTGTLDDLRWIPLDHKGIPEFDRAVYEVTRAIAPGHTLSYGQVAARIGAPGAAQAVGQTLGRNPIPLIVPCHRVLAADHALHGFSAPGGLTTKQRLLEIERTPGFGEPTLF
ncbi:methylated-DNA--[protein]-cysteine S-methyltransferase [Nocardia transvalensis]|uniref:methylated-DNA--[protein]-cysteine S-methyltransferase n=1 Tax=Nocardia transvalensis TaxID=37333 RepID=UPI0018949065|nr:methylated-DNA--[protein]-cysteine S-methyltransferase [Nocardia transvalensis]MBF6329078.1 methylated-DNA--[protein]-cysteine S-methyltransferase [Nocardia transvalensis]